MFLFLSTLATGTLALALSSNLSAAVVGEEERFRAAVYEHLIIEPSACQHRVCTRSDHTSHTWKLLILSGLDIC